MRFPHSITIPADGSVYDSKCRWQDIAFGQKIQISGDQSIDADGHVFFPTNVSGLEPDLAFKLTLDGETQTGKIVHVERVGKYRSAIGRLIDEPQSTTLGTIDDLAALAGDTRVVLTWTGVDGATSYQAKVDGVLYGSATTDTAIEVTGLTNGTQYTFVVVASDGSSTTESNSVNATPSA